MNIVESTVSPLAGYVCLNRVITIITNVGYWQREAKPSTMQLVVWKYNTWIHLVNIIIEYPFVVPFD